jgi:hypothetical protein
MGGWIAHAPAPKATPGILAGIQKLALTQVERVAMLRDAVNVLEQEKSPGPARRAPRRRRRRRAGY